MIRCPQDSLLQDFVRGEVIDDPSSDDIARHLDGCEECQRRLDDWLDDSKQVETPESSGGPRWDDDRARRIAEQVRDAIEPKTLARIDEDWGIPNRLGDYELLNVLGEGGMGIVYRARQAGLNRMVALKVVSRVRFGKRSLVERFFHEAESAARLEHPGIVRIYDVGEASGQIYYAMAYIPGGNLAQALADRPYSSRAAAECLRVIADAIAYAHERGIIHRDLKPANVLLDERGNPRVADFGLAKQIDSVASLTVTGEVLGTPSYMPPEQARVTKSEVTVAGDVYSLGAILFHLLTGRPPFVAAEPVDVLHQLIHDEPIRPRTLNPAIDQDLETIALKSLSKSPEGRYESVAALREELDRYLEGRPIHARPTGALGRASRWCRRKPAIAGLLALVLITIAVGSSVSTSFGILAQRRAADLTKTNASLRAARAEARTAAAEATAQAEVATQQADAAIRILETMLFELQTPYRTDATAQEERRRLLNTVLNELDRFPNDLVTERRIARCRGTALVDLADVVVQAGDGEGRAASTGSLSYYRQAIEIFQKLHDQTPEDPVALRDLARALTELGDTLATGHQWTDARQSFESALVHWQHLNALDGEDDDSQLGLADIEILYGESLMYTDGGVESFRRMSAGRSRAETLLKERPNDRELLSVYGYGCLRCGAYHYRAGENESAHRDYEEFRRVASELAGRFPLDYEAQMKHSTAYEKLGDISLRRGDTQLACEQYEKSLRLCVDLARAAPDNDQIQWDVAFSYQKLADGYLRLGDLEASIRNARQCVEMRRRLVQTGPTIPLRRVKLNHALKSMARSYQRNGEPSKAAECYREAIENATAFDERMGTNRFATEIASLQTKLHIIP